MSKKFPGKFVDMSMIFPRNCPRQFPKFPGNVPEIIGNCQGNFEETSSGKFPGGGGDWTLGYPGGSWYTATALWPRPKPGKNIEKSKKNPEKKLE